MFFCKSVIRSMCRDMAKRGFVYCLDALYQAIDPVILDQLNFILCNNRMYYNIEYELLVLRCRLMHLILGLFNTEGKILYQLLREKTVHEFHKNLFLCLKVAKSVGSGQPARTGLSLHFP